MRKLNETELRKMRKMLNKAWNEGSWREKYQSWARFGTAMRNARYRDVSKIIKEAQKVDWLKLNKPDNVEEQP